MLNINQLQEYVNTELDSLNFEKEPKELYAPITYTLQMGGKRIRPVLCLMAAQLFNAEVEKCIQPALALEVFHNFTLLHDDVMDNANMRRNRPTVHKKWNDNIAILSGDTMLIKAYQFLSNCDPKQLPMLFEFFNTLAIGVCEGQHYDMEFEERVDVSIDEYIKMIKLKTAILLAGSLKVGAILANASDNDLQNIYDFGLNIGLAFQLKDDYLDCFGNEDNFGKKIGGDIVANKKTFLLIKAIELANGKQKEELLYWLNTPNTSDDKKVTAVLKLYKDLGVDKLTNELMENYYQKALQNLEQISDNTNDEAKSQLRNFAELLIQRDK